MPDRVKSSSNDTIFFLDMSLVVRLNDLGSNCKCWKGWLL